MAHVLLVGDEPALPALLGAAGYRVTVATDPHHAIGCARDSAPDIVLLDFALPQLDGRELVHALRLESDVPVVILADREQEAETIAALVEGADDFVDAPFDRDVLLARLRIAAYRRTRGAGPGECLTTGCLSIDLATRRVKMAGRPIRLSPKEYALLRVLALHPDETVGHRRLLAAGWGPAVTDSQYLRVYVGLLRQKIEEDPSDPRLLLTEPGIGYRLAII